MATEAAPAKINLCLHVTGQRADGYHLLDSIVVFAGVGDQLSVADSSDLTLSVTGPMAGALTGLDPEDNLVLRAARLMAGGRGAALTLDKHLPQASGIGGGSADAAATLRLLARVWGTDLPLMEQVLSLGADLPVCLSGRPCRMQGIGEVIRPIRAIAPLWLVLVNPRQSVPTPAVFRALQRRDNAPLPDLPDLSEPSALIRYLTQTRNDLEAPALSIAPAIGDCLTALRKSQGCLLARMSGSGATCFGLYADEAAARASATGITRRQPEWWTRAAPILA
jgi:4-diphosphocytidyl-2-C-methyl-D-erythritol kinase